MGLRSQPEWMNLNTRVSEMDRGRLLFYIKFHGGTAYLDVDNFKQILNIEGEF